MKSYSLCFLSVEVRDKNFKRSHIKFSLMFSLHYAWVGMTIDDNRTTILPLPFMGLVVEWGDGPC